MSQYRATFNFGTVTKLNKWLGWQNSFGDIYVSNPPLGTKKNDLQFTTGINSLSHTSTVVRAVEASKNSVQLEFLRPEASRADGL